MIDDRLADHLAAHRVRFCVIGSVALAVQGVARHRVDEVPADLARLSADARACWARVAPAP